MLAQQVEDRRKNKNKRIKIIGQSIDHFNKGKQFEKELQTILQY